jgi:hypothetical protein
MFIPSLVAKSCQPQIEATFFRSKIKECCLLFLIDTTQHVNRLPCPKLLLLPPCASVKVLTYKVNLQCVVTYMIKLYISEGLKYRMVLMIVIEAYFEGLSIYSYGETEHKHENLSNYRRLCGR